MKVRLFAIVGVMGSERWAVAYRTVELPALPCRGDTIHLVGDLAVDVRSRLLIESESLPFIQVQLGYSRLINDDARYLKAVFDECNWLLSCFWDLAIPPDKPIDGITPTLAWNDCDYCDYREEE